MSQQQKLAMLLQPSLIRLIDQLRQQLSNSIWKWSYETHETWPESVSQDLRDQYELLIVQLENATEDHAFEIQTALDSMPTPIPLYLLELTGDTSKLCLNMWELCYQICLRDYVPELEKKIIEVPALDVYSLDLQLFDSDDNIDWSFLDQKAALVVGEMVNKFSEIGYSA